MEEQDMMNTPCSKAAANGPDEDGGMLRALACYDIQLCHTATISHLHPPPGSWFAA